MVVIRLARLGTRNAPKYRVNVADSRCSRGGRFIETVGHYNPSPSANESGLHLDMEKITGWIAKGAQPTDRVKSLMRQAGKAPAISA
jgi:small subunit ribosomal protein S16